MWYNFPWQKFPAVVGGEMLENVPMLLKNYVFTFQQPTFQLFIIYFPLFIKSISLYIQLFCFLKINWINLYYP